VHIEVSTTANSGFQPKEYSRNLDCGIAESQLPLPKGKGLHSGAHWLQVSTRK